MVSTPRLTTDDIAVFQCDKCKVVLHAKCFQKLDKVGSENQAV